MKITVLGGGGVRSMFLAKSIAQKAKRLGIDRLCFMDNDEEKLRIYGGMGAHVARLLSPEMDFTLTADPVEAVRDADYVITTIRVGQDEMRAKDERIALDHGVLGQETTGAAGLSFAMRSVPALAAYCELIKKYAKPSVKVFNFTNPAGVVSQTLRDMGYDFTYGICDAPSGMLRSFALLYGADPANQLQILLVYGADPVGNAALWPYLAGDLHHIVRPQTVNGIAIGHAQDHGAGLAALGVLNEFQRHARIAAVVCFVNIKVPGLAALFAGLAGHIAALSHTVPFVEYCQTAFKVVFNIHLAQLGGHLPVNVQDLLAPGLGRF